jgi:uncharacterized protein (TIGR02594 family)
MLPNKYAWLGSEHGPRILVEFLKIYGTTETPGPKSNPTLLRWAKGIGLSKQYRDDSIPWCGLGMAYAAQQAGWDVPVNPLWARNWLKWGTPVKTPMLGDTLVFRRGKASGHVGTYVGEDAEAYHVIGANQDDAVSIKRIAKSRLLGARRCPWRVNQPKNVRRVMLAPSGVLSKNEA